ncbi:hypothetical protein ACROYT_G043559 [Oculina patagonica]
MNNISAINTSSKNATGSSVSVPSTAEGIAWCSAFILASIFIVVGNLLVIILFAVNKKLRKKSLFLVVNMAFADLMLGALALPIYIYDIGVVYALRIPEFREALASCCFRRNKDGTERRNNAAAGLAKQVRTLRTGPSHLQLEFEQEVMDTKL